MTQDGKIGPRMDDVVNEILDMTWIYETVSKLSLLIN